MVSGTELPYKDFISSILGMKTPLCGLSDPVVATKLIVTWVMISCFMAFGSSFFVLTKSLIIPVKGSLVDFKKSTFNDLTLSILL